MDERARVAAVNNAAWCEAVWRSHGIRSIRGRGYRAAATRAPATYPDAVTLAPDVPSRLILARIDDTPGCSIKDSFCSLDLRDAGYEVLFEAAWYWREPGSAGPGDAGPGGVRSGAAGPGGDAWRVVRTARDLARWGRSHGGGGVFRASVLADPAVRVLARPVEGGGIAGAVASLGGGVVGVSNVFSTGPGGERLEGLVDAVARIFPGRAIVGYDAGGDLRAAMDAGFTPVGPLHVWLRR